MADPASGCGTGEEPGRVSTAEFTRNTLVGFHRPSDPALMPAANAIVAEFKIRGLGSATLHLAYVAAGLLDGCVDFNVKIWDLAAAIPFVLAAGGEVRFLNGEQLPLRQFDPEDGTDRLCGRQPRDVRARLQQLMAT